ncbi:fructose-bisphosphate aldolase class II [Okibacterium sp. HSC-33S16]|uniref:class II fructose-bisphosphate aldolase n=1 Tax=Okibacterium sp. HSC-33S16 TaxID=2910965 RepID=UPI0020A140BB|nr:class II fructose-bisphosphate aldolase [Okibacterium sp. HSC-33S16]MCP2030117.1 fructose-bisphosphate aldolase class II [Okibacterium sp. HSC-33S16]
MTLSATRALVDQAYRSGTGIGAFNVVSLETAEGLVSASEHAGLPVILQISENCARYHGSLAPLAKAVLHLAEHAATPISLHLDHAEDEALAFEAIDLGFSSVMYDGARLPYAENVAATRRVAGAAHAADVYVEAELGTVGGKDGPHAPGVRTDPDEARSFVANTGVDALAVAVGSSHAMTDRVAALDLGLIATLRAAVPVPLVLHGSSGVTDAHLVAAIAAGMTKVNVSTHLNGFYTRAAREVLDRDPGIVDPRKYLSPARDALEAEAARLLTLFAQSAEGDVR